MGNHDQWGRDQLLFETPKEAALRAEVARLKSENDYLRRAVSEPETMIGPECVVDELRSRDATAHTVSLHHCGGVRGQLLKDGRWHVLAYSNGLVDCGLGKELSTGYFAPGWDSPGMNRFRFCNEVIPRMHEKLMRQLGEVLLRG